MKTQYSGDEDASDDEKQSAQDAYTDMQIDEIKSARHEAALHNWAVSALDYPVPGGDIEGAVEEVRKLFAHYLETQTVFKTLPSELIKTAPGNKENRRAKWPTRPTEADIMEAGIAEFRAKGWGDAK